MKRIFVFVVVLGLCGLTLKAQQEVFFADTTDVEASYVASKIQAVGLSLGYKYLQLLPYPAWMSNEQLQAYYLHELRLMPYVTLCASGGLNLALYSTKASGIPDAGGETKVYAALFAEAEARIYPGQRKRYLSGKSRLNSGFYFGLPLSLDLYYNQGFSYSDGKRDDAHLSLPVWLRTSLGYRYAPTEHFFMEAALDVGGLSGGVYFRNPMLWSLSASLFVLPRLKAVYCF